MQQFEYLSDDYFDKRSSKQIMGEVLEIAHEVIYLYLDQYVKSDENFSTYKFMNEDFEKVQKDFSAAMNFFINYFEKIAKFNNNESRWLKTSLFELRSARNNWAHNKDFTINEIYRTSDTIIKIFDEMNLQSSTNQYKKAAQIRDIAGEKVGEECKQRNITRKQQQLLQQQQLAIYQQQMQQQQFLQMQQQQQLANQQQQFGINNPAYYNYNGFFHK